MKNNIIYLYLVYFIIVCLLLIIDITVLMYYIFWFTNIFIYPLLWLWLKIVYYNRTILLLLLFYYFIAKYTIKQPGYKYFSFFNIDLKKWQTLYLDFIFNLTTYHIEMVSIFLFFFVIIMPLFLYYKEITLLITLLLVFIILLIKIIKTRLTSIRKTEIYIKKKGFFNFLFISFFFFLFIKVFKYHYINDIYTLYLHLDVWVFDLLEWKIQTYKKAIEKDYYSNTVGLKPIWFGEKLNKKEYIDNKYWEFLCKKKKKNLVYEFKYKLKKKINKYYLYFKYYDKLLKYKTFIVEKKKLKALKLLKYPKILSTKDLAKEIAPKRNIKNENPVVTQEKTKERILHKSFLSTGLFEFTLKNYYRLNYLLKELTSEKLYYQPFTEKKNVEKHLIYEKKKKVLLNFKERIKFKDELQFFKQIIKKIKINKLLLKKMKMQDLIKNKSNDYFFFNKLIKYLFIEKEVKKNDLLKLKNILRKSKTYDYNLSKKKEKFSMKTFLRTLDNNFKIKKNINKLFFPDDSKNIILNKDRIKEVKKSSFYSSINYINKKELEKFDNQHLFNMVKQYNEEKIKVNLKSEFYDNLILKQKKGNLILSNKSDSKVKKR